MEKKSSNKFIIKLKENKKEIIITAIVLIVCIIVGIVVGKVLYESMYGPI